MAKNVSDCQNFKNPRLFQTDIGCLSIFMKVMWIRSFDWVLTNRERKTEKLYDKDKEDY